MTKLCIVLDSVSLKSLHRPPKPSKKKKVPKQLGVERLIRFARNKRVYFALDKQGGIEGEWCETCGTDSIQQLIIKLDEYDGIRYVNPARLAHTILKRLKNMGFNGAVDKVILKVAVASPDKKIVSDDSDFWDPADKKSPGSEDGPVFKLCRDSLGVQILLVTTLFSILSS